MIEKKFQTSLWMCVALVCGSAACGSSNSATDTVANARAAALTNQIDDDMDGTVDENDEGLDEDQDGLVDESNEHRDACRKRRDRAAANEDAGVSDGEMDADRATRADEGAAKDDATSPQPVDGHTRERADADGDHARAGGDSDDAIEQAIAAIDCSDTTTQPDASVPDAAVSDRQAAGGSGG